MRISDWSSDVCSSDLVAIDRRAADILRPAEKRFAAKGPDHIAEKAPQKADVGILLDRGCRGVAHRWANAAAPRAFRSMRSTSTDPLARFSLRPRAAPFGSASAISD